MDSERIVTFTFKNKEIEKLEAILDYILIDTTIPYHIKERTDFIMLENMLKTIRRVE